MNVKRNLIRNWSNRICNIYINNIIIAINMYNNIGDFHRHKPWINWACLVGFCNIVLLNHNEHFGIIGLSPVFYLY